MLRGFGREVGDPCPNHCAGPNGPVLLKSFGEGSGCDWCGYGINEGEPMRLWVVVCGPAWSDMERVVGPFEGQNDARDWIDSQPDNDRWYEPMPLDPKNVLGGSGSREAPQPSAPIEQMTP